MKVLPLTEMEKRLIYEVESKVDENEEIESQKIKEEHYKRIILKRKKSN